MFPGLTYWDIFLGLGEQLYQGWIWGEVVKGAAAPSPSPSPFCLKLC